MLSLVQKVAETLKKNSYTIYDRPFELNLVAIRKDNARERTQYNIKSAILNDDNLFFDQLILFYYDENEALEFSLYDITTVPQIREHQNSHILVPNQYQKSFALESNRLVQTKEVDVFYDDFQEKKSFFDPFSMQTGSFNIGIANKTEAFCYHRFKDKIAYKEFLELCHIHIQHYGNSFTYTLLEEHEIVISHKTNYVL